jgi:thymidylate synthase
MSIPHVFAGGDADEVWRKAAQALLSEAAIDQGSRGGETRELLHVVISVADPRQRWVVSRFPAMNPAYALVETFWILAGRRDSSLPIAWNPALPRFAGDAEKFHGAYGFRLRHHFGIDQLDRVHRVLEANPSSRQAVLQIWDAASDLPDFRGMPADPDIPCNVIAIPKLRNSRLEWLQVMRSNDAFRGFPYNIVQFTTIQETIAGWLGVEMGGYTHVSDSFHAYTSDLAHIEASKDPVPFQRNLDTLALPRAQWQEVIQLVLKRLDGMAMPTVSIEALKTFATLDDLPQGYLNALLIAGADRARRRGWVELAAELGDRCTNPCLQSLWQHWQNRQSSEKSAV